MTSVYWASPLRPATAEHNRSTQSSLHALHKPTCEWRTWKKARFLQHQHRNLHLPEALSISPVAPILVGYKGKLSFPGKNIWRQLHVESDTNQVGFLQFSTNRQTHSFSFIFPLKHNETLTWMWRNTRTSFPWMLKAGCWLVIHWEWKTTIGELFSKEWMG